VIFVAVTVTGTAITPLNNTLDAPPNALPYNVNVAPTAANDGVNEVTRGSTNKVAALVAVPPAVVTEIDPSDAPAGTHKRNCVGDKTANAALTPCTLTALTPPKPVPSTTTELPAAALPGPKPLIVGTARKLATLTADPPAVTTDSRPVVAVAGTTAVIW
jgi:hypothetical protein